MGNNKQKNQKQNSHNRSKMRQIAAYALLVLGGKPVPAPEEVAKVVREAGVDPEMDKCIALCAALEGKKFEELVETGLQTLRQMEHTAQEEKMDQMPAHEEPARDEEPFDEEIECCNCCGIFGDDDDY